jgi:hypothetical protein
MEKAHGNVSFPAKSTGLTRLSSLSFTTIS